MYGFVGITPFISHLVALVDLGFNGAKELRKVDDI